MNIRGNKKLVAILGLVLILILITAFYFSFGMQPTKSNNNLIRVACVGDSITEGTDYPNELWMLLGQNYSMGNFGEGGTTVSLNAPTPYMDSSKFKDAKGFKPQIVIIMLGTNDANPSLQRDNQSFVNDYTVLVQSFRALSSKPQIWLVKPPPIFEDGTGLSTQYFDEVVVPNIERVTESLGLSLIDVYGALKAHSEYFPDGVHPNVAGSRLIAQVVFEAIA
jgi:lysophospholipase L1-like esterase